MPAIVDKLNIVRVKGVDRRIKLSTEDIAEIKRLHATGISIHKLSKIYNVSRRLIQFRIYPERYKRAREIRKKNGEDGRYYNKEYNTEAQIEHRNYKRELLKKDPDKLI